MKFRLLAFLPILFISTACFSTRDKVYTNIENLNIIQIMKITSSAFEHNQLIPAPYTCDGKDINPPLNFKEVPENAKSLVLIVDDPDAPKGTWLHWTVWNIDPKTREIGEGNIPSGAQEGVTDFGRTGYGGPCPPSGTHRYFFKLYAIDTRLSLKTGSSLTQLQRAMQGHVIVNSELIGLYKRQ